jgi:hypothetical protein
MSAQRFLLSVLALVALAGTLRADPPLPLDLIPKDACIGIAIRNLADLRTKSDRLFGKDELRGVPRPSQLLDAAFGMLELNWKVDEKKPAALVCLSGTLGGFAADVDLDREFTIGAVLAPRSLEEVAKSYKIDLAELKKGQVHKVPGKEIARVFGTTQAGIQEGQIYLTGKEKATAAWMKARSLRAEQPAARQRRLDAADGVVYFGPPLLRLANKGIDPESVSPNLSPEEAAIERRLNRAFLEARHVLAGYRVDDGFGLDLSVEFDPKGTHAKAVLKAVSGAGRTSNLTGLPDSDRLLGAAAAIGLDRPDLHLARVLAGGLWSGLRGASAVNAILDSDAVLVRRIFGDLYSRLQLGRVAVYQSSDTLRQGQMSVVAILDPIDAGRFLTDIAQYARLGDVEKFDPKEQASKAEIEKLIAELGSDDFQTRESASTKLGLIGDAALPYLEKAEKSDDPEVRRRAEDLRTALRGSADLRKKELAEGLVKKAFRPTFTLQLRAEKRADASVHLLGMRFDAKEAPYAAALKDLFGPEWNRLRVAVVNKQVVVLLGSELDLLEEAIRNVRDGKLGLEQSASLAEFRKHAAPERRIEVHLALHRLRMLFTPANELPKDFKATGAISSVAVRTGLNDLGLDLWAPAEAVPDALKWLGIW